MFNALRTYEQRIEAIAQEANAIRETMASEKADLHTRLAHITFQEAKLDTLFTKR